MSLQPYNSVWGIYISPMGIHPFNDEYNVMRKHWDQREHHFPDDDYTPSVSPESVGRCCGGAPSMGQYGTKKHQKVTCPGRVSHFLLI